MLRQQADVGTLGLIGRDYKTGCPASSRAPNHRENPDRSLPSAPGSSGRHRKTPGSRQPQLQTRGSLAAAVTAGTLRGARLPGQL